MIGLILRYRVQLAGLLLVGILLGVGMLVWGPPLVGAPPGALEVVLPVQTVTSVPVVRMIGAALTPPPIVPTPTVAPATLKVYVVGAIAHPGVYPLFEGDRIEDAVRAAGGALADADLDSINLSARVQDEEQIRVPHRGDSSATPLLSTPTAAPAVAGSVPAAAGTTAPVAAGAAAAALPAAHSVNINSADATTLATLPGIGPVLAGRIIAYRTAHGLFAHIEDIKKVSGIGDATFAKISAYISTGP